MQPYVAITHEADYDPDLSWLDQTDKQMGEGWEEESRKRKEGYQRGDWYMVGIVAHLVFGSSEVLTASLWGIESDSGDDYFKTVEEELRAELACQVPALIESLTQWANSQA